MSEPSPYGEIQPDAGGLEPNPPANAPPLPVVRDAVRSLLLTSPAFRELDDPVQRNLAWAMVKVCDTAAKLLQEEIDADRMVKTRARATPDSSAQLNRPSPRKRRLSTAQSAGTEFSGVAASRVAGTTQAILNAVSFPRFVTELINGVFKAMIDSSRQQMQSFVELLNNVAASTEGFADSNMAPERARQWLAERYPGSFVVEGDTAEEDGGTSSSAFPSEPAEDSDIRLRLRPEGTPPSVEALRTDLGLGPDESVPTGDPEQVLVPLARRALARQRQQMMATMVMLGMQRIVIDSGRIHASMRFHIDTRSAAQEDRGSQTDFRNTTSVAGSFGYGPWGASASMTNTIGYVSTQKSQSTEEMNTDLDLNSSVELVFKTDYLPLERMAGQKQIDRIKVNTLNPEAELKASTEERKERQKRIADTEKARRESIVLPTPAPPPAAPKPGEPATIEAAERARREAAEREKEKEKKQQEQARQSNQARQGSQTRQGRQVSTRAVALSKSPSESQNQKSVVRTPAKLQTVTKDQSSPALPAPGTINAVSKPDVIYVPSQRDVIHEMLTLAKVQSQDLLYDLGCGDGRVVITATREYGCRSMGFDVDPARIREAHANVRRCGLQDRIQIVQADIFKLDLFPADVLYLYLLPELNTRLIPQIARMKVGARIISHDFDMAGIIPDRVVQVFLPHLGINKTMYLWTTPLKKEIRKIRHQWANAKPLLV